MEEICPQGKFLILLYYDQEIDMINACGLQPHFRSEMFRCAERFDKTAADATCPSPAQARAEALLSVIAEKLRPPPIQVRSCSHYIGFILSCQCQFMNCLRLLCKALRLNPRGFRSHQASSTILCRIRLLFHKPPPNFRSRWSAPVWKQSRNAPCRIPPRRSARSPAYRF